jgi:hypothetical protein
MRHCRIGLPLRIGSVAVTLLVLLTGCAFWREKSDPEQFEYQEPDLPPLVQPETIPAHEYLRVTPSGRLYPLKPARIAIASMPDFQAGSDPKSYLRNQVTKAKGQGSSFLPFHYYLAPEGIVFEGQSIEYAGDLGNKRVGDAVLVGVLGDYGQPANFMPPAQEKVLIQLCAWLCSQHSIEPSQIVPASEISPDATPLGTNLMNWFGPTDMLRERVRKTLQKGGEDAEKEKNSILAPLRTKKDRRPPDINEDF